MNPILVSWLPLLIALIGISAPVIKTLLSRDKVEAETRQILTELDEKRAERLREETKHLEEEIKARDVVIQIYRERMRRHGINPDIDTGPMKK